MIFSSDSLLWHQAARLQVIISRPQIIHCSRSTSRSRTFRRNNQSGGLERSGRRLLGVGLCDLAHQLGPIHVDRSIDRTGIGSSVVFEDLHHESREIREDNAGLRHAQQAHLMFGLTERAAGIYCDIGVEALVDGRDGRKCSADLQREPAKINFFRPVASIAFATRGSSKALTEERSMICTPGNAWRSEVTLRASSTPCALRFSKAAGRGAGQAAMLAPALSKPALPFD